MWSPSRIHRRYPPPRLHPQPLYSCRQSHWHVRARELLLLQQPLRVFSSGLVQPIVEKEGVSPMRGRWGGKGDEGVMKPYICFSFCFACQRSCDHHCHRQQNRSPQSPIPAGFHSVRYSCVSHQRHRPYHLSCTTVGTLFFFERDETKAQYLAEYIGIFTWSVFFRVAPQTVPVRFWPTCSASHKMYRQGAQCHHLCV